MLSHIKFGQTNGPYRLAILVKDSAMRQKGLEEHYVKPLLARGFSLSDILVLSLEYNAQGKAPAKLIKEYSKLLGSVLAQQNIGHVLVADAAYFKVLCKVRKAEPHYGYVLPTIWPGVQAALTINYTQLFHNPSLQDRLTMSLKTISKDISGDMPLFFENVMHDVSYPRKLTDIEGTLHGLLERPALTVDVETLGLHLRKSLTPSISFAWDRHSGTAFLVHFHEREHSIKGALKEFFMQYRGKTIYHNATFDIKMLIHQLWMGGGQRFDLKSILAGLDVMYRNTDCTKVLSYLATNSAVGNKLGLKDQAFEFVGNYELEEIKGDIEKADRDELLTYNLTDTLATWYVYDKHRDTVRREQEEVYQNIFRPALKVITQMELCGLPLRQSQIAKTRTNLNGILAREKLRITSSAIIQQFEKELRLLTALEATAKLKKKTKTADDYADLHFNPRSTKQVRQLLYDSLDLPVLRYTDTGLASTDSKTLDALIQHITKKWDL